MEQRDNDIESMKQIKVRGWDAEKQEFHYWTLNDLLLRFGNPEYADEAATASPFFNWMLSTGLTDKNGKEIHDGDLLLFVNKHGTKHIWEVFMCETSGMWKIRRLGSETRLSEACSTHEVIGNIYQNPELLK
jgi:uncharacterized phage protein (TIGR01671 family)